ncbi:DUF4097 family beta strand repeat-containing protein [Zhihengliuella flava]|uniref:DUF4097 domain-containing protein n=1 Tax=Zhihengliuella flava TaxID=1285193 RepID=A0A931DC84_9MICC|nr:DUF4097 family beta strand repeat-containing protein [Zhihengliuella flava]MBG6084871.1 hypothetical protein [Zhihengliuella flava]
MKRPLAALAAVALLAVTTGCTAPAPVIGDGSETRSFTFDGDRLAIDSHNSSLQVTARDVDEVQVRRELTGTVVIGSDSADWSLSGDRLNLERQCTGLFSSCRTAYQVVVPLGVELDVSGRNGTIQVAQLDRSVDVTTRNGRVEVEEVAGDVFVKTNNGAIDVRGAESEVKTISRNGDVQVRDTSAEVLFVRTNNGSVDAQLNAEPRNAEVETRNGAVDLQLPGGPYDVQVHTGNGSQRVNVPTDASSPRFVRVNTNNGAVTITSP